MLGDSTHVEIYNMMVQGPHHDGRPYHDSKHRSAKCKPAQRRRSFCHLHIHGHPHRRRRSSYRYLPIHEKLPNAWADTRGRI